MYKPCDISTFLVFVNTYILLHLYIFIYILFHAWYVRALLISLLTNFMSVFPFSQLTAVSTQVNKRRSLNVFRNFCSLLKTMWNDVICYTWVRVWLMIILIISSLFFVNILGVKCSEIIKKFLVAIHWSDVCVHIKQKTFCVFSLLEQLLDLFIKLYWWSIFFVSPVNISRKHFIEIISKKMIYFILSSSCSNHIFICFWH